MSIPRRHINRRAVCAHGDCGNARRSRPRAARGGSSARRPRRDSPPTLAATPAARGGRRPATADALGSSCACGPSKRTSWRNSSLASRWRARIRSPRRSSRARTRSRSASASTRRDRHAVQLAGRQQPHQPLGVAAIGLDAIARRRAGSTPARRPDSRRPPPPARARARTRSAPPHRSRAPAPATPPRTPRPRSCARQPPHPQLARIAIQHRGDHAADVHIEGRPGLSLRHVGTPMIAVGAQATPGPSTRASHARVPTLTSPPDARRTDRPYGLAVLLAPRRDGGRHSSRCREVAPPPDEWARRRPFGTRLETRRAFSGRCGLPAAASGQRAEVARYARGVARSPTS